MPESNEPLEGLIEAIFELHEPITVNGREPVGGTASEITVCSHCTARQDGAYWLPRNLYPCPTAELARNAQARMAEPIEPTQEKGPDPCPDL